MADAYDKYLEYNELTSPDSTDTGVASKYAEYDALSSGSGYREEEIGYDFEKAWEADTFRRLGEATKSTIGSMTGVGALGADILGATDLSEDMARAANMWYESAGDMDIAHQAFGEIDSIGTASDWLAGNFIELFPSLVGAAVSGGIGGLAVGGAKIAGQKAVKNKVSSLMKKKLQDNLKKRMAVKGTTTKEAFDAAYKDTVISAGRSMGVGTYTAAEGAGGMYMGDVNDGDGKTNPWAALAGGAAQGALTALSPVDNLLAGKMIKGGWKEVAKSSLKEMVEESGQEGIDVLHGVGISDELTLEDAWKDQETWERLAASGILGAVMGGGMSSMSTTISSFQEDKKTDEVPTLEEALEVAFEDTTGPVLAEVAEEEVAPVEAPVKAVEKVERVEDLPPVLEDNFEARMQASIAGEMAKEEEAAPAVPEITAMTPGIDSEAAGSASPEAILEAREVAQALPVEEEVEEAPVEVEDTVEATETEMLSQDTPDALLEHVNKTSNPSKTLTHLKSIAETEIEKNPHLAPMIKDNLLSVSQSVNARENVRRPTGVHHQWKTVKTPDGEVFPGLFTIEHKGQKYSLFKDSDNKYIITKGFKDFTPIEGTKSYKSAKDAQLAFNKVFPSTEADAPTKKSTKGTALKVPYTKTGEVDAEGVPTLKKGEGAVLLSSDDNYKIVNDSPGKKGATHTLYSKVEGEWEKVNTYHSQAKAKEEYKYHREKVSKDLPKAKKVKEVTPKKAEETPKVKQFTKEEIAAYEVDKARKALEATGVSAKGSAKMGKTKKKDVSSSSEKELGSTLATGVSSIHLPEGEYLTYDGKGEDGKHLFTFNGGQWKGKETTAALDKLSPTALANKVKDMESRFDEDGIVLMRTGGITIGDVKKLASTVYSAGQTFRSFAKKMREYLGDKWGDFKDKMKSLYTEAKQFTSQVMKDETGAVGKDISVPSKKPVKAPESVKKKKVVPKEGKKGKALRREERKATSKMPRSETRTFFEDKANRSTKDKLSEKSKGWGKKALNSFDNLTQSINERLRKVHPRLRHFMNKYEARLNKFNGKNGKDISPFLSAFNKLGDADREELGFYLSNMSNKKDYAKAMELIDKHGLKGVYKPLRATLDSIYDRAEEVGLNVNKRQENYFPRRVNDLRGLMNYLSDNPKDAGPLTPIIESEVLSDQEKADAIQVFMNTNRLPASMIKSTGSSMKRSINRINPEMYSFYSTVEETLQQHIEENNAKIEGRVLLGATNAKKLLKVIKSKKSTEEQKQEALLKLEEMNTAETDGNITDFLLKTGLSLTSEEQNLVTSLIRARLNQKGMHGMMGRVRDMGLITALGSPLNTLTQLGDLPLVLYKMGVKATAGAAKKVLGKKGEVTYDDMNLSNVMKEFQTSGTSKWVESVLKVTGFAKVDQFFKEVYSQAAVDTARKMPKEEFLKKHSKEYGEKEASKVWEDIQKGDVKTDEVLTYVFSEISEMQPISLSEMPKGYLEAGNLRILYTLKSYSMKLLSSMRREMLDEAVKGNYGKATKNFMKMVPMLVLANAGIDEMKDWLQGKEEPFSDNVMNNLLKLFMTNRYDMGKIADKGIGEILTGQVEPPILRPVNDLIKDTFNMFPGGDEATYASVANIPLVGRLGYKWSPEGRTKTKRNTKLSIREDIKEAIEGGDSLNSVRKRIAIYNRDLPKGTKRMPYSVISDIRKQLRKDEVEKRRSNR